MILRSLYPPDFTTLEVPGADTADVEVMPETQGSWEIGLVTHLPPDNMIRRVFPPYWYYVSVTEGVCDVRVFPDAATAITAFNNRRLW